MATFPSGKWPTDTSSTEARRRGCRRRLKIDSLGAGGLCKSLQRQPLAKGIPVAAEALSVAGSVLKRLTR
jgi:hypothetical protein